MAQYDLHLIQNTAATGVEFSEKQVNIAKGSILSAIADGTPTVLPVGTNGYILVPDDTEPTGLKWKAQPTGHTQNTDTGTIESIFHIDSDGFDIELTAQSATKFGILQADGVTYSDLQVKDITANSIALASGTISGAPSVANDIVNKTYADGLLAANDAMIYKGTVGTGGDIEKTALEGLTTYNAGWSYRVITADTYFGKVCEIGDLITAVESRAGTGAVDADWSVFQANLDGAVIGPASVTDGYLVQFDGTTGKLIKAGTGTPGTMAYETAADYVANALFNANTVLAATTDNTPAAVTVGASTFVGRKATGDISAMSAIEARTVLNVEDGADVTDATNVNAAGAVMETDFDATSLLFATTANTPIALLGTELPPKIWAETPADKVGTGYTGTAIAGQIARDANYIYYCDTGGIAGSQAWSRSPKATNWT